jgi:hypothetical protein
MPLVELRGKSEGNEKKWSNVGMFFARVLFFLLFVD